MTAPGENRTPGMSPDFVPFGKFYAIKCELVATRRKLRQQRKLAEWLATLAVGLLPATTMAEMIERKRRELGISDKD